MFVLKSSGWFLASAAVLTVLLSFVAAFPGLYLANQEWELIPVRTRIYFGPLPHDHRGNDDEVRISFALAAVLALIAGIVFILAGICGSARPKKSEIAVSPTPSGFQENREMGATNPYESPNALGEFSAPKAPELIVRPLVITMLGTIGLTTITFVFVWLTGFGFMSDRGYLIIAENLWIGVICSIVGMFPVSVAAFFGLKYRDRTRITFIAASIWAMLLAATYYYFLVDVYR